MRRSVYWFAAFTAVFAVCAAFVFWGTWSPDFAPVMPDDAVTHPLAFSEQFGNAVREWLGGGSFAPAYIPWSGLFVSKYWVQEFKYAFCLYVSALGLAVFLRGRGLSRAASYGAGLLLGFCGYWCSLFSAGHYGWFLLVASVVPAFAFLDRAIVTGDWRLWFLFGASLGWGCCYQQDIFLLFFVLLAAYGVYACVRERRFPWKGGCAAALVGLLIGAPGIRHAFGDLLESRDRQIEESAGTALTGGKGVASDTAPDAGKAKAADEARWIFVTNWSMPPEDTLEFLVPRVRGDTSCPMTMQLGRSAGRDVRPYTGRLGRPLGAPSGNYRQHSLYVGFVTCLLALFGVLAGVRRFRSRSSADRSCPPAFGSDVLFFLCAAFVCWLFSMGRFCEPVYRIVYQLPFGDYLRAPVKWHHMTEFCLCVIAGFGLQALYALLVSRGLSAKVSLAAAALVAVVGAADLARIDRLYCAPIDLRVVRGRNAAAEEVVRRGKGAVCDLVEGGRGLLAWSFSAHGVRAVGDPAGPDVRFVFAGAETVARNPRLAAWLKARATPVGGYAVTRDGIRNVAPQSANVTLYQLNGVPAPAEKPRPPVDAGVVATGVVSLLGTLFACGCLVRVSGAGRRRS